MMLTWHSERVHLTSCEFVKPKVCSAHLGSSNKRAHWDFLVAQRGLMLLMPASMPGGTSCHTSWCQAKREKTVHCAYLSKTLPSRLGKKKTWEVTVGFYSMQLFQTQQARSADSWTATGCADPTRSYCFPHCSQAKGTSQAFKEITASWIVELASSSLCEFLEIKTGRKAVKLASWGLKNTRIQIPLPLLHSCILWVSPLNLRASIPHPWIEDNSSAYFRGLLGEINEMIHVN